MGKPGSDLDPSAKRVSLQMAIDGDQGIFVSIGVDVTQNLVAKCIDKLYLRNLCTVLYEAAKSQRP